MIRIIKPILIAFVTSRPVKELVCELLDKLAESTENELDDVAVRGVRTAILGE
tara:strand:+ start:65 stop:223 length:159 start_codon:yes stop_codon:yes gene_type:complete